MGRLSALEVFPTLRRLPGFRPRSPRLVPIGFQPRTASRNGHENQVEKLHPVEHDAYTELAALYHDLGVLAFDGCNSTQIKKIGKILHRVMTWGGVDGLRVALREPNTFAADLPWDFSMNVLASESNRDQHGNCISGQMALDSMMASHEWAVTNNTLWGVIDPSTKKRIMENLSRIGAHGYPERPGTYLETDRGTRRLRLRARTVFRAFRKSEQVHTETWISTKGRGDILGSVRARYQTGKSPLSDDRSDDKGFAAVVFNYNKAVQREQAQLLRKSPQLASAPQTAKAALEGLWKLERETWADRSNAISEEDREADAQRVANAVKRLAVMPVDANTSQPSNVPRNKTVQTARKRNGRTRGQQSGVRI